MSPQSEQVLVQLAELWRGNKLCDVELAVGDRRIPAHRAVLAAGSAYFHAMFCGGMRENSSAAVTLHEVDADAVVVVLAYMYCEPLCLTAATAPCILAVTELFALEDASALVCKHVAQHAHAGNAAELLVLADLYNRSQLRDTMATIVLKHFVTIATGNRAAFHDWPAHLLCHVLGNDDLCAPDERLLLDVVLEWVCVNVAERRRYLREVLDAVRANRLSLEAVENAAAAHPLVGADVRAWATLMRDPCGHASAPRGQPTLFVFGGVEGGVSVDSVVEMDVRQHMWGPGRAMRGKRRHATAAYDGLDSIFIIGGIDESLRPVATVEKYNVQTGWSASVAALPVALTGLQSAVMGGRVYVTGGSSDFGASTSLAFVYDTVGDAWLRIADMNIARRFHAMAAFGGFLYVFGGRNTSSSTGSVERWHPTENAWHVLKDMLQARSYCGCAVTSDSIFLIGGEDAGWQTLRSVSRYWPEDNIWQQCPSLTNERAFFGAAAIGGQLFVVGGSNQRSGTLPSVEMWNGGANDWVPLPGLSLPRQGACCVIARRFV